ncbi:MAG: hypothetical protein K6E91_09785 [Butyrivibrio sp.]|nr:hypothetical protein [Butyrivibrio sp.]
MFRKSIKTKLLTTLLSFALAFSALPGSISYADNAVGITFQSAAYNEGAVDKAYSAVMTAKKSGKQSDKDAASELVKALSPTNKVRLYIKLSKDYYQKNYKKAGFKFFDVKKYLEANPDVRKAAENAGVGDIEAYALDHYLEIGVYEARGSKTEFDPVEVIISKPGILVDVLFDSKPLPEAIFDRYVKGTGRNHTNDIVVSFAAPTDSKGKIEDDPSVYVLYVYGDEDEDGYTDPELLSDPKSSKDEEASPDKGEGASKTTPKTTENEYDYDDDESDDDNPGGDGTGSDDSDYDDDDDDYVDPSRDIRPTPTPTPTPTPKSPYINAKTEKVTPYKLYENSSGISIFSFEASDAFSNPNAGEKVDVVFFGDNYEKVRELAKGKKYTLMIYFCGTDLERKENYRKVTIELADIIKGDASNVNVILCVGGTTDYKSTYVNKDSSEPSIGLSGLKTGIYYLNPEGLSDDVRQRLSEVDVLSAANRPFLFGTQEDVDNKVKGLRIDDIITKDSLIQLSATTAIDMGDPSLLAGFINLSTNLFPAQDYGLILSDHGGGVQSGICFSDSLVVEGETLIKGSSLTTPELEGALAATDLYSNKGRTASDGKFGLIMFDACLMGSTELAYNLKDYYRYMLASEEITYGTVEYGKLLNTINSGVGNNDSDKNIAIEIDKGYSETTWHKGSKHTLSQIGSMAVFSSDDMDDMYSRINVLSRNLTDILNSSEYSQAVRDDVFKAIRKAAISCYPTVRGGSEASSIVETTGFVDIGEFMLFLKTNLDALNYTAGNYSDADIAILDKIKTALDEVLDTGFISYLSIQNMYGLAALEKEGEDGSISLNYNIDSAKDIWTDVRTGNTGKRDYIYGSSIYLPLQTTDEEYKKSKYYEFYANSDLKDYVGFVDAFVNYYNTAGGYRDNMVELAKELTETKMYSKLITLEKGTDGDFSVISDAGRDYAYITFKVADSYEEVGMTAPQHSTGNPLMDILETQGSIQVAAIHKEYFKAFNEGDKDETYLAVNMVCAESALQDFNVALDTNTITLDVTSARNSVITGMSLEGTVFESGTDAKKGSKDWQFVLKSKLEASDNDKQKAINVVFENPKSINTEDILSICGGYIQSIEIPDANSGETLTVEEKGEDAYHLFKLRDNNNYDYSGTVTLNNGDASLVDNVIAISAYHYVMAEVEDAEGNIIASKKKLEDLDGIEEGYFTTPEGGADSLVLKTNINVTEYIKSEDGKGGWTPEKTGYVLGFGGDIAGTDPYYSEPGYHTSENDYNGGLDTGKGPLDIDFEKLNDDQIALIGQLVSEEYELEEDPEGEYIEEEEEEIMNNDLLPVNAEENRDPAEEPVA